MTLLHIAPMADRESVPRWTNFDKYTKYRYYFCI